jgi:hypothetical protein
MNQPEPNYSKGDEVWLTIKGQYGCFSVVIASDGEWVGSEQQWKYQVRQTDGMLYEKGELVSEKDLERKGD